MEKTERIVVCRGCARCAGARGLIARRGRSDAAAPRHNVASLALWRQTQYMIEEKECELEIVTKLWLQNYDGT